MTTEDGEDEISELWRINIWALALCNSRWMQGRELLLLWVSLPNGGNGDAWMKADDCEGIDHVEQRCVVIPSVIWLVSFGSKVATRLAGGDIPTICDSL